MYDDPKITLPQAVWWVMVTADYVKAKYLEINKTGEYLHTFPAVPVLVDNDFGKSSLGGRNYVELPKPIYDLRGDRGIDYISYPDDTDLCAPRFAALKFTRTTIGESKRLYMNRFEVPSPQNPYYYRTKGRIYFLGIEGSGVDVLQMGLYITLPDLNEVDIDEPFDFPHELIATLRRELLDIGRFALLVPRETLNDGASEGRGVPTQKIASVNQAPGQQVQAAE